MQQPLTLLSNHPLVHALSVCLLAYSHIPAPRHIDGYDDATMAAHDDLLKFQRIRKLLLKAKFTAAWPLTAKHDCL